MVWAHEKAKSTMDREKAKHKRYFDKKARSTQLLPGDKVLIRKGYFCGLQKLADRWESPIYRVIDQRKPGVPAYNIILDDGSTQDVKTLHRNRLLPLVQEDDQSEPDGESQTTINTDNANTTTNVAVQAQFTSIEHVVKPSIELATKLASGICTPEEAKFWSDDTRPEQVTALAAANQAMEKHFTVDKSYKEFTVVERAFSFIVGWLFWTFIGQWTANNSQ
jgi:hypothetical protein